MNKDKTYIYVKLYIKPQYQARYNKVRYVRYVDDGHAAQKVYLDFIKNKGIFHTLLITKPELGTTPIPSMCIQTYSIISKKELKKSIEYYLVQDTAAFIQQEVERLFNNLKSSN